MAKLNDVVKRVDALEKKTTVLPKISIIFSTIALILVFL